MSRQKTAIISGANGYFGAIATQYFHNQGWKILKATRQESADIYFDLNQPQALAKQQIKGDVDLFIHAAAAHEIACRHQPYRSICQNIVGTKAALDFCVANGIPRFIYLSTFHVFGYPQGNIDENTPPFPNNDYGLSHLQAEDYVQMYNREHNINGTVIRPSNFFGIPANLEQFQRWSLAPFAFCNEAVTAKKITLKTQGFQQRNFISILDICAAINGISAKSLDLPLLHLYGQDTLSIRELAQLVQTVMAQYYYQDVQLIIPDGISQEVNFSYSSCYLQDIYKPHRSLEEFIVNFCQKLLLNRQLIDL